MKNVFYYIRLANAEISKGNFKKAIPLLEKAIKLEPDNKLIYVKLGNAFKKSENYDKAIKTYLKAKELGYSWKSLLYKIGFCFYKKGDIDNALKFLPDKGFFKSSKLRGHIFFEKGEYDKAIEEYEEIVFKSSDSRYSIDSASYEDLQSACKNMGKCFFIKGEYTK